MAFCLSPPVYIDQALTDLIPEGRVVENGGENEFVRSPDISEKPVYFGMITDEVQKITGCPAGKGKPVRPADQFISFDWEFPGSEEAVDQFCEAELSRDAPVYEVPAGYAGSGIPPLVFDRLAGDELGSRIFGDMAVDILGRSQGEILGRDDIDIFVGGIRQDGPETIDRGLDGAVAGPIHRSPMGNQEDVWFFGEVAEGGDIGLFVQVDIAIEGGVGERVEKPFEL